MRWKLWAVKSPISIQGLRFIQANCSQADTLLRERIRKAKRVYIIGNGGSYANAQHIANDLIGCGIKAYTLDAASLTASANDFGFENVFATIR